MKIVVAALVSRDGRYLIARRKSEGALGDKWEFPGGKVEPGESDAQALEREIIEEFNTLVDVGKLLATTMVNPDMQLKLYDCTHKLGGYQLREHSEIAWVGNLAHALDYDLAPADVELLSQVVSDDRRPSLHELIIGESYQNDDIKRIFLVSGQGGMRRSKRSDSLVLFAQHHTDNPYEDTWGDDGIMHYTGMGLTGDQSIDYAQNKTLAESRSNDVDVHLFESFEPKQYVYRGQVELVDDPYRACQKDQSGNERQVIRFPLRSII